MKSSMPGITVKDRESIDDAIRRFKRECERNGLIAELKRRDHFESPTVRKKKKMAEAARKKRRKEFKARTMDRKRVDSKSKAKRR